MELNIRRARLEDLTTMLLIMDNALGIPSLPTEMEERRSRWQLKLQNDSDFIFLVVENDDKQMIGWCRGGRTLDCHRLLDGENYECEVQNIFILSEYQRRGIGRKLWFKLFNELIERYHPTNLIVWSVDKEESQQFYRSLGGQQREQRRFDEDCVLTAFTWCNHHDSSFTSS